MRNKANQLIKTIQNKIDKWNERSQFTIKGVKNLSMSDLDTLILYAETIRDNGNYNGLMKPLGNIEKILQAYELIK